MANSFDEALDAVNKDPELKERLAAAVGEDKRDVLQDAGVTVPSKKDYDAYVDEHGENHVAMIFMGGVMTERDDRDGDDAT